MKNGSIFYLDKTPYLCYTETMRYFAIGDLHLSGKSPKPMNIFGDNWTGHFERIRKDWLEKVSDGDVVLLCGDHSWAMSFEDGMYDLNRLSDLPGKKVLIRGNHDYWWSGITKLRTEKPNEDYFFLQNDCVRFGSVLFVGSRGWTCPGASDYTEADEKIYKREAERFRLAFEQANKERGEGDKVVVLMHFPPFTIKREDTLFTKLFESEGVSAVVFGHIHGAQPFPLNSEKNGVEYFLTSCDKRAFTLTQLDFS